MAVIDRTVWYFSDNRCIRNIQGVLLVLISMGVIGQVYAIENCYEIKQELGYAGFPVDKVPEKPDASGQFCGAQSCCGFDVESIMLHQSRLQLDNFVKESASRLSNLIDVRARKFDSMFREMMNNSKREFHNMFQKTYGKAYLQNADVFSNFFDQLEAYYRKGALRLSEMLDSFFGILYHRMFTVMNSQYTFDEKYLDCVSEHMAEMKPFGDLPNKLSMQLRRSFVATRTYYKALTVASETAKKMTGIKVDEDCGKQLIKMQHCGQCNGYSKRHGPKACSNYCANTAELCLKNHVAFSTDWDNFIEALDKVADRLVGPFNIEMVVEPLNIKISEAVMDFQEKGKPISQKIFNLCGKPELSRKKRRRRSAKIQDNLEDNPNYEVKYETLKLNGGGGGGGNNHNSNNNNNKKKKNKKTEPDDSAPSLEKLIKEIKIKIRETRQFWAHLPYQYCNNGTISAPPSENGNCWNGTTIGDFNLPIKQQKPTNFQPSIIVNEQIFNLQVFSDKLRKAHQGDEVEIVDDSEDALDDGGDGSGSGSGAGPNDDDDDGSDDDDDGGVGDNNNENTSNREHIETIPSINSNGNNDDDDNDILPEVLHPNNVQPDIPSTTRQPEDTRSHSSANTISLSKALAQYLLPIVLVWFGGAITDLL